MNHQEMKICSGCQKDLPRTPQNFYFSYRKSRGKTYPSSRCRPCLSDYDKKYRRENPDSFRKNHRRYDNSPFGIYKKLRQSIRGHKVVITQEEFVKWYSSQQQICCYCGITLEQMKLNKDSYNDKINRMTIDRLDSSKPYEMGNLGLCCLRCNHTKSNFFTASEMEQIGNLFIKRKWNNATTH